eukprot:TRINITY_DN3388_c0_g1_i1.p1 TRINITY_DN3388_c0_g1~~TRINITY_DN3388_c0_g1_i1.p1  ORF type:complete len:472 (-),score=84.14 TRINITY_DN3388_c0_g1_i1:655-2070(-)
MAGSSDDDQGAPDSWELVDLEDSMRRLLNDNKASCVSNSSSSQVYSADDSKPSARVSGSEHSVSSVSASNLSSEGGEDQRINQVDQFLRDAIQNPRERLSVLRMEQDVLKFLHNPRQEQLEFCQLPTSYLRLAAHRIAQHYCMQSSVVVDNNSLDGSSVKIIIRKTAQSRLPSIRLAEIPVSLPQDEKHNMVRVAIKQRPQKGSHSASNPHSMYCGKSNHAKSVEERKEEYNKARARIFSASTASLHSSKSTEETSPFENYSNRDIVKHEKSNFDEGKNSWTKAMADFSSDRTNKVKGERELSKPKNNRVAIFRDRETERKDPDYDRSIDKYTQRFDPGFGFNVGPYSMQALYTPAVNYNTEFPQLGAPSQRAQMAMEPPPRPMTQPIRSPWVTSTNSIAYTPLDTVMGPFNAGHMGAPSGSALYMHSSQFSCPGPTMAFVRPHEQLQQSLSYPSSLQQQHESCYNQARPR